MLPKFIQKFKQFSKKVAVVQARIILTIVYIIFVPIFAVFLRMSKEKKYSETGWLPWILRLDSIDDLNKQF